MRASPPSSAALPFQIRQMKMASPRMLLLGAMAILTGAQTTTAFGGPPPPPRFPPTGEGRGDGADDDGNSFGNVKSSVLMCAVVARPSQSQDDTCIQTLTDTTASNTRLLQVRGGGIADTMSRKRNDLATGLKGAVDDTLSYWGGALDFLDTRFLPGGRTRQREKAEARSAKASATAASRQAKGRGPKTNRKRGRLTKEEKMAEKLADTVIVKSVSAPNSTVLPTAALTDAGRQSGLVGGKFVPETVQQCAARVDPVSYTHLTLPTKA